MVIKSEVVELLEKRLGGTLAEEKIQALAAEIIALNEGWEEVNVNHRDMGYSMSVNCPDMCWLAEQIYNGAVLKIFRKQTTSTLKQ